MFYQLGEGRLFTLTDKHVIGEALNVCRAEKRIRRARAFGAGGFAGGRAGSETGCSAHR